MFERLSEEAVNSSIEIDEGMKPLVNAMNRIEWLTTISCCEGHEEQEINDQPYVAFMCKASKINDLSKYLAEIENKFDKDDMRIYLNLCIVFTTSVYGCQEDMRRGWVSFHLSIGIPIRGKNFEKSKAYVLETMVSAFKSVV